MFVSRAEDRPSILPGRLILAFTRALPSTEILGDYEILGLLGLVVKPLIVSQGVGRKFDHATVKGNSKYGADVR